MKILFISSSKKFFELHSNERKRLEEMSRAAERVYAVIVTSKKDGLKMEKVDDHTWIYPTNSRSPLFSIWDAWRIIRSEVYWRWKLRANIIISDDPGISGWIGTIISLWYKRRWVVNIYRNFWTAVPLAKETMASGIKPLSRKYLLKHAGSLCVFSSQAEKALVKEMTSRKLKGSAEILSFTTIVDVEGLRNTETLVNIHQTYPNYNFILLSVFDSPIKGEIDLALETLLLLRQRRYPRAGLVIISRSDLGQYFDRKVEELGLYDWIKVETEDTNLVSYLKSANTFLNFSDLENDEERYMFMRAASAGAPIVSLESALAKEVIIDNDNGLLIKEPKPELFFVGIVKTNETPGLREQFKIGSDKLITNKFAKSQEELKKKLLEVWSKN